jgi:hypothetical protein
MVWTRNSLNMKQRRCPPEPDVRYIIIIFYVPPSGSSGSESLFIENYCVATDKLETFLDKSLVYFSHFLKSYPVIWKIKHTDYRKLSFSAQYLGMQLEWLWKISVSLVNRDMTDNFCARDWLPFFSCTPDYFGSWKGLSLFICNCRHIKQIKPRVIGFKVLTAVVMYSSMVWEITPCITVKFNRRFGGTPRMLLWNVCWILPDYLSL